MLEMPQIRQGLAKRLGGFITELRTEQVIYHRKPSIKRKMDIEDIGNQDPIVRLVRRFIEGLSN